MGAYLQLVTPGIPLLGAFLYHGAYDIPLYSFECTGVFTNKTPTDAYRGAGRPEATYAIERSIEALAAKVGVGPDEIRRRNFIKPEQFPYTSSAGLVFDSGDYEPALDRALELVGYDAAAQGAGRPASDRRDEAPRHRHLVVRRDVRPRAVPCPGVAELRRRRLGVGHRPAPAHRQGAGGHRHRTARARPRDELVDARGRQVRHRPRPTSTSSTPTPRSRRWASTPMGHARCPSAASRSRWRRRRCSTRRARSPRTRWRRARTTSSSSTASSGCGARRRRRCRSRPSPSRRSPRTTCPTTSSRTSARPVTFDPPNFTFPFGTHVAVVEVDEETGDVRLLDYAAVDDCGNQVNPLIVSGQLHGGIVQGVAQALWEEAVYDEDGQLRNATLMDYLVPSAAEVPSFKLDHTVTPSPTNPLGVKGIGEAGTIARDSGGDQRHRRRAVASRHHRRRDAGVTATAVDAHPGGEVAMIPASFDYVRAESPDHAVQLLQEHGDDAKLLAGGHSLLPLMKLRLATPSVLIDVGRLTRPVLRARRRRPRRDRRAHPASRPRALRPPRLGGAVAASRRRTGRRPASAPSRHDRRIDRARRPRVRPSRRAASRSGRRWSRRDRTARARSASTTSSPASSRRRWSRTSC